ncbi:hypothetical protein E3P89_00892 [Wallemia ichthyophaga]|uniref:CDC20/Fizzy WD40 domain-containing protein n=3 Tax=Wallemia ichthyophaga TaxID=245174 RepID=A0A4T0HJ24_WALIC|nr:Fizzy-related protein-like protein [Wallemia ichthyophaga EXF-994]TIB14572.1 hypothetical protein E3P90_01187 [Wallemia ichthyophaga]EOR00337.1 Fizzy-related protein-like protein [Wallemia ichthyophaga EXF-994]TIB16557.1 hypothetical protein E3P93_00938 [Wallemia ichthyophaga]TIB24584.1 hypothetical protein E3P89_00892 [Wallemia ichthyophaga]TIB26414.1 hypothetical protein E3P88_01056 [Wallemia ichthyophaga]
MTTPKRSRKSDRFIPSRSPLSKMSYNLDDSNSKSSYNSLLKPFSSSLLQYPSPQPKLIGFAGGDIDAAKVEADKSFSSLLSNELLNDENTIPSTRRSSLTGSHDSPILMTPRSKVLQFMPSSSSAVAALNSSRPSNIVTLDSVAHDCYNQLPIKGNTERILKRNRSLSRRIPKVPWKVLDAPGMVDDQYTNLLSWSSHNMLAVALGARVFIWIAHSSQVFTLSDPSSYTHDVVVTSLQWIEGGTLLAVGRYDGLVQIWDASTTTRLVRTLRGHDMRVGTLAWASHMTLASGSRDRSMLVRDLRTPTQSCIKRHNGEITSLTYDPATNMLASGGNDNKLYLWDTRSQDRFLNRYYDHEAAVTALAFNPHHRGILASGGGTNDRRIVFRDILKSDRKPVGDWDTGSQVCNLWFSQNTQELLSTSGYSSIAPMNQLCIWKYPSMSQVTAIGGHICRPIHMGVSADRTTVATGSADETIRIWKLFPEQQADRSKKLKRDSAFNLTKLIR